MGGSEPIKLWLVKSGGRVLGPFPADDISRRLREGEFVPLDECALPFKRWQYIRDTPDFARVVEEVRVSDITGDTTTTSCRTESVSVTEPLTSQLREDDLTDEVSYSFIDDKNSEDAVFEDLDSERERPSVAPHAAYGMMNDRVVRRQASQASRSLWLFTVLIILGVAAFVGYTRFISTPLNARDRAEQYYQQGMAELQFGNQQKAMEFLNKAFEALPEDSRLYLPLGALRVQVEAKTVEGRRLLEKALAADQSVRKKALTGIGVAELTAGNIADADNSFSKALEADPNYLPAMINRGAVALLQEDFSGARTYLESAIRQGSKDGAAYLMLSEAYILMAQNSSEEKEEFLQKALDLISHYRSRFQDYSQEMAVASGLAQQLSEKPYDSEAMFTAILDIDPQLTTDHQHDLFVYRDRASWSHLSSWCKAMYEGAQELARAKAFYALCLFKADNRAQAGKLIEDAVTMSPRDPLIQAVYGRILFDSGMEDQASVALGRAEEFDRQEEFALPLALQARFCAAQKDWDCANERWKRLLQMDAKSLPAHSGLAQVQLRRGYESESRSYLQKGLELSSSYGPLLRVKAQLEGSQGKSSEAAVNY